MQNIHRQNNVIVQGYWEVVSSISGAIQLMEPTAVLVTVRMFPITVATPKSPIATERSSFKNMLLGFKSLQVNNHIKNLLIIQEESIEADTKPTAPFTCVSSSFREHSAMPPPSALATSSRRCLQGSSCSFSSSSEHAPDHPTHNSPSQYTQIWHDPEWWNQQWLTVCKKYKGPRLQD